MDPLSGLVDTPLSALIVIPLVGALLALLGGAIRRDLPRWVGLTTAVVEIVAVIGAIGARSASSHGYVREMLGSGEVPTLWNLFMDGLATPLVALTAVLAVVAVLASWKIERAPGAHHAMLLLLVAATMGVFLAADFLLLYVFWEAVLIPMFFLIGRWGHERRRHAAIKFFVYTFLGSAFMLVGLLVVMRYSGTSVISECVGGAALLSSESARAAQPWVFWLLCAGFLVKVPVVPLHTWLPDAHVEAPTAGSIMLAGVLLKMGGYGMLRLAIPLAPEAYIDAMPILAGLGIVGIVYGAFTAMAQTDLKRLVAYSSVAHMGFVILALGVGTAAAIGAAMLSMISHGVISALLFLLVGLVYERTHTREIARMGGFMRTIPAWGVMFSFAALASLGLPGLSGFPGELMTLLEAYGSYGAWIVVALVGLVVSAAYHLWAIRRVNHGTEVAAYKSLPDLDFRERAAVLPLALGIVALGVWPGLVLSVTASASEGLATIVEYFL